MILRCEITKRQTTDAYIEVPDDLVLDAFTREIIEKAVIEEVENHYTSCDFDSNYWEVDNIYSSDEREVKRFGDMIIRDYVDKEKLKKSIEIAKQKIQDKNQIFMDFGELPIGEDTR